VTKSDEAATDHTMATGDDDWIVAGHLRMNPARGEAWSGTRRIALTAAEFRVLELLVTQGSQGVTQEAIAAAGGLDPADRELVDGFVTQLRRKTGFRGRDHGLRKERIVTYYLDDSDFR
jgi:DNA-binding response OmpR family regulator